MFKISVCMIVKNESDVLARILKCASCFADEIIVVDTGSTDNTKEIAKSYTDKVFDYKWTDDFSAARNFAFEKATCDYQMWLDADDFITDENIKKLQLLKNNSQDTDVFMLKYATGFDEENAPALVYFRERILKRSKHFKWKGFVHEAIAPSGNIEYSDITIEHRKMHAGDPKRNLKLYNKALKNGKKFNAREQYYFSRELFYNNHISSAVKNFKKFLKMQNAYLPDVYGAYIMLSDCYFIKKDTENARKVLFEALKKFQTAELCCKIGYTFEKENAVFWFKTALICEKQDFGFVREDYSDIIPYLELTKLSFELGNFEEAKRYHCLAKIARPKHPSVIFNEQFFS